MKSPIFASLFLSICLSACNKTEVRPDPVSPVTDSVPVKINTDTSTLVKSMRSYDADDTAAGYSSVREWTYDNQRRVVQTNFKNDRSLDTVLYNYQNNFYTVQSRQYFDGSLIIILTDTFFQRVPGKTDSLASRSIFYASVTFDGRWKTYFYYNARNQDSLEKLYDVTNDLPAYQTSVYRFYTGSNLDSIVGMDVLGRMMYINHYSGGDQISGYMYNSGVLANITNYTYLNVASGGLSFYLGTTKLLSGSSNVTIPATNTISETDTYQFDAAHRVTAIFRHHPLTGGTVKEVYTYY